MDAADIRAASEASIGVRFMEANTMQGMNIRLFIFVKVS